jgi:hypothetical protein
VHSTVAAAIAESRKKELVRILGWVMALLSRWGVTSGVDGLISLVRILGVMAELDRLIQASLK